MTRADGLKEHCCCGRMSVHTGVIVIACISILVSVLGVMFGVISIVMMATSSPVKDPGMNPWKFREGEIVHPSPNHAEFVGARAVTVFGICMFILQASAWGFIGPICLVIGRIAKLQICYLIYLIIGMIFTIIMAIILLFLLVFGILLATGGIKMYRDDTGNMLGVLTVFWIGLLLVLCVQIYFMIVVNRARKLLVAGTN